MNTTIAQPLTLKVSRFIKAPRERVFAAWITPSDIGRWLGGDKCQIEKATIDARVGGEYQYKMKGSDAGKPGMSGVFREVKSPERLVFTWMTGSCDEAMARVETLVTVEFTAQAGGTLVELTHAGFPTEELREQHNEGWTASFDKLEKLV
jgi:glutathione S-transferase